MSRIGRMYSSIVFRNISIVITAGILNILFGVNGWKPDTALGQFIDPLYRYILPIMLAYTGGKVFGGHRGGVTSAVALLGLIIASDIPMILGAILLSPLIGWVTGWMERKTQDYIPIGSELLVANLLDAFLGLGLLVLCYFFIGPLLNELLELINSGLLVLIDSTWLPFLAVIIEPAKVLFLNNVVNHGLVGPLGIQQTRELGKSIFFLIEANPGPGFGVLAAYLVTVRKKERLTLRGTMGIQLFGGIHEVYFPYVLMRPMLFLAVITGGISGIMVFQLFGAGLVSTASPASLFLLLFLAPGKDALFVTAGICVSGFISYIIAYFILAKSTAREQEQVVMGSYAGRVSEEKERPNLVIREERSTERSSIHHITVVCDGGMASSAMGAAILRRKLQEAGQKEIEIEYRSFDDIPAHTNLIVSQEQVNRRINKRYPHIWAVGLQSLSDLSEYDKIVKIVNGTL